MNELAALSGVSLAWRPETAWLIHSRKDLAFSEVLAENLCAEALPTPLLQLRRRGVSLVPHGVSLSLGSVEGYSRTALDHLARLAERLEAPCVSEHIAFVRAGGVEAGHLLPVARSEQMLDVIAENVRKVQQVLPVPLALEPIAALFEWPDAAMDEATFVREVLERTGCRLVLDLANVYANGQNLGSDPVSFLDSLSQGQVAYVHVAGGCWDADTYHDTHGAAVGAPVLGLLGEALDRFGPLPVLIERDDHFGTRGPLEAELDTVAALVRRPVSSRPSATAPNPRRSRDVPRIRCVDTEREQQIALVRSLVLEQPAPPGFDAGRLGLASRMLEQKRARVEEKRLAQRLVRAAVRG